MDHAGRPYRPAFASLLSEPVNRATAVSNLGQAREMMRTLGTIAAVLVATLAVAPLAHGAEQTRDTYRERVEPICKRDTLRSKRILKGAQRRIRQQKLVPAGRQFVHVSRTFGRAVGQIARVPRPPADVARLGKWAKFLRIVQMRLRNLGKRLIEKKRVQATHASIHLERSANAANNVSFIYEFDYCRITRARFG